MNGDAVILALLALADLSFFLYLRQRHARRVRVRRMYRALAQVIRRELAAAAPRPIVTPRLRRQMPAAWI